MATRPECHLDGPRPSVRGLIDVIPILLNWDRRVGPGTRFQAGRRLGRAPFDGLRRIAVRYWETRAWPATTRESRSLRAEPAISSTAPSNAASFALDGLR